MTFQFDPIGTLHTCYKEKFGIPRQSNLVEAPGTLVFHPEYAREEAIRGLEAFSHIWLVFIFHEAMEHREATRLMQTKSSGPSEGTEQFTPSPQSDPPSSSPSTPHLSQCPAIQESHGQSDTNRQWAPMVRPPRLGGNKKVGVFSSRSPFRPNPIGISAVCLESVELGKKGPLLHLTGVDILDQTPILDIKPYIPYSDALLSANDGFAPAPPRSTIGVVFSDMAREQIKEKENDIPHLSDMITGILENDPRPAYHSSRQSNWGNGRIFGIRLFDFDLKWTVEHDQMIVLSLEPLEE